MDGRLFGGQVFLFGCDDWLHAANSLNDLQEHCGPIGNWLCEDLQQHSLQHLTLTTVAVMQQSPPAAHETHYSPMPVDRLGMLCKENTQSRLPSGTYI
jgi:hypothetical protein